MKLLVGLPARIIVVAVVSALAGAFAMVWIARTITHTAVGRTVHDMLERDIQRGEYAECAVSPSSWRTLTMHNIQIDAYDGDSLRSHNPLSPALDDDLLQGLREGEPHVMKLYSRGPLGGALAVRTAAHGPCAVFLLRWPVNQVNRRAVALSALLMMLIVLAATMLLVWWLIVRPLKRRISMIANAVQTMGEPTTYVPAPDTTRDGLGDLAHGVDVAHKRIIADAARLAEQQHATERFLEDVMHDLRTPITSLQLTIERLGTHPSQTESTELLRSALNDAVYLGSLTENLRLATRLADRGSERNTPHNLCEVLQRLELRERVFARLREIHLAVAFPDDPVIVRADPTAVERAITNIVQNAVSYGRSGDHVSVLLEFNGPSHFRLTVEDDGPGVAPAELPRLGKRAFRSDFARSRDPKGSGLGLAITHTVCQQHDWTLEFASRETSGLRVVIEGPVEQSASVSASAC